MADDRARGANPLAQLLVTEAIREFECRFDGMSDKALRVEHHICKLGRKPGFAMASQLLRSGQENVAALDEIGRFLAQKFSPTIFGVQATKFDTSPSPIGFTINFAEKLPAWFSSILSAPSQPMTPDQTFWFRCYASFVVGVFAGALLHFGFRVTWQTFELRAGALTISYRCDALDGAWEYSAAAQH
jgi:hypothetical protein